MLSAFDGSSLIYAEWVARSPCRRQQQQQQQQQNRGLPVCLRPRRTFDRF